MRIALFGSEGQLGREFLELPENWELRAFSHKEADITDRQKIENILSDEGADVILNTAAYNAVDQAEDEPEEAFDSNGLGPYNLALLSLKFRCVLVHFSSNFVFDGAKGRPYLEDDPPNPLSTYGKSKLMGELAARVVSPRAYIIRTSCLYGRFGENFLTRVLGKADRDGIVKIPNDLTGSPTYALHLAKATAEIIKKAPPFGTYHIVNAGFCTRYEWAKAFLESLRPRVKVEPISVTTLSCKAKRPVFSALASSKTAALNIQLPTWKVALEEFIRDTRGVPANA